MKLRLATPAEKISRDLLTYREWGTALTRDQFLMREARLRAQPWARTEMSTWVLCDDDGAILSSCETFRMSSMTESGEAGTSYGIASVYTDPTLRHRGYASRMLTQVSNQLQAENPPPQTLILFSEVGAEIYAKLGFKLVPSFDWVFPATLSLSPNSIEWLSQEQFLNSVRPPDPKDNHFQIFASAKHFGWHFEREKVYCECLGHPLPEFHGVRIGDSCAAWTLDHKKNRLQILFLKSENNQEAATLISASCEIATRYGLQKVQVWESEPFLGNWADLPIQGNRIERSDSLAMIYPIDSSIRAEHWKIISRSVWM